MQSFQKRVQDVGFQKVTQIKEYFKMVREIRSQAYWFLRVVFILCIPSLVFVLYYHQRQSTQQAVLIEKNKRVQQPQLAESTENVALVAFMKEQSEVQLKRHKYIQETCAKNPHLQMDGISSTTSEHILVLDRPKLLFCFIPKTGCTNWKRMLMVIDGYQNRTEDITPAMAHAYFKKKKLSFFKQTEQKRRLQNYTKIIFTRHPFERVLSAYGSKFTSMDVFRGSSFYQSISQTIMKKFRKNATPEQLKTGENITWDEWTSYLTESRNNLFYDHWKEFFQLCSPCHINYDYIGKLDSVSNDSKYILTNLGVPDKVPYPSKSNSQPTNSSQNFEHYMSQLSHEKIKKLWEVYRLDFELFGYPKPQF